jgi:alpha-methylacyl-CoA racemase
MSKQDSSAGLLAGIKILDLSGVGPGARCARMLADLGAEVTRVVPPPRKGSHRLEGAYHSYGASRGWRRVMLDLKQAAGRDLFFMLATQADVVVEGFRPGVAGRLGIGYESVVKVNPKAVYCSLSGYGQTGPAAGWVGHDLNYDALAGMLATSGVRPDGAPAIPGLTVADSAGGGMHAVISILAALLRCRISGEGSYLDVSMTEGVLYLMSMHVDEYLATGKEPGPGSSILTGGFACYDLYKAADGLWISLGAIEAGFFANVCKLLGCEQWIPHQMDRQQQDAIRADFRCAFAGRSRAEWLEIFGAMDSCVAPVNGIAQVADDPHFVARGAFIEAQHPEHGRFRQVGALLAGSRKFPEPVQVPSAASTDTAAVLAEIGIDTGQYQKLVDAGVVS